MIALASAGFPAPVYVSVIDCTLYGGYFDCLTAHRLRPGRLDVRGAPEVRSAYAACDEE